MPTPISNTAFAASIAHDAPFNAYQDIVWSLQYALCGSNAAQGGFCTFLYNAAVPLLTGGGIGASLGYAPSSGYNAFASISGLSGAMLGIGLDTLGLFAATGDGKNTGVVANNVASLTIRTGSNFTYLATIALSALDSSYALMSSALAFETLRFRLHSAGTSIEVARFDGNEYKILLDYPVSLNVSTSSFCKVGVSYAAPLCGNAPAAKFAIKNFHVEGVDTAPIVSTPAPPFVYDFPVVQNLSIETPQSTPFRTTPATTMLGGTYVAIDPPVPGTDTSCPGLCLDPFVLVYVFDVNTYSTDDVLYILKEYNKTSTIKKISIITFGNNVCPQVITFDNTIEEAINLLTEMAYDSYNNSLMCEDSTTRLLQAGNGIDALHLAATILRDYDTPHKKYVYFLSQIAGFKNNVTGTSIVNEMLNDYADGVWMVPGMIVNTNPGTLPQTDLNTLYVDYIPESPIVKYNYFPSCPSLPIIPCNTFIQGAGAKGIYTYAFDAGTQQGWYIIDWISTAAPVQFKAKWGSHDFAPGTCYVGSNTYNAALTALGLAPVADDETTGNFQESKNYETPNTIKIMVNAPFDGADWQFRVRCYGE
jgi:hypothetical protein